MLLVKGEMNGFSCRACMSHESATLPESQKLRHRCCVSHRSVERAQAMLYVQAV